MVVKSHQFSLERPHTVSIEVNSEVCSSPMLFRQKHRSLGLLVTKIYKNKTMTISLFNYSMLGYI